MFLLYDIVYLNMLLFSSLIVILFVLNNTTKTDITGIMLENNNIFLSDLFLNIFSYNLIAHIESIVEIDVIIPKFISVLNALKINIVINVPNAPSLILKPIKNSTKNIFFTCLFFFILFQVSTILYFFNLLTCLSGVSIKDKIICTNEIARIIVAVNSKFVIVITVPNNIGHNTPIE